MSGHIASRDLDPSTGAATRVPARAATGHTPGPWAVQDGDVWDIRWPEREGTERLGCPLAIIRRNSPIWDDRGDLPFEANARLISAAPDLLEALQWVMSAHGEQLHDAFDAAHKAIAKATSEPQPRAPQVDGEGSRDEPLPPNPSIETES